MLEPMVRFFVIFSLAIAGLSIPTSPLSATPDDVVSAEYQIRSGELLEILKGSEKEEQFFASSFLDAVPLPQFRLLLAQLKTQYGEPIMIARIIRASDRDGTIEIEYEKATLAFRMVIDQATPNPVIGLLVTGAKVRGDSLSTITEEFKSLPGSAGFQVARIDTNRFQTIAGHNAERQYAIGSTFKLYILAELSRSIKAGERKWDDVIRINRKSLPSGILQNWPENTPMTLQSLAALMISISDNTATDLLIKELGRGNIGNIVTSTGHGEPAKTLPILTTLECFALKMPSNADLRQRYQKANDQEQLWILTENQSRLKRDSVAIENLANQPQHIEEIEWFASPFDTNKLLYFIASQADPIVKDIMAMSNNLGPGDSARWSYVGSKGGSEPGVVSYAFLATSKTGQNFMISGSWNNPSAPVDSKKFQALMNRLLNLLADRRS